VFLAFAATFLTGCATAPKSPDPLAIAELAPTGKLRSAHLLANAALVTRDEASGRLRGITIDLAEALAREAGVPLEPIAYPNVSAIFQALERNELDLVFLANDPARAGVLDFACTYMEVAVTYAVPVDSPIRTAADADRAGVRIAVGEKNAADLYLSRSLRSAELVRGPYTVAWLGETLQARKADAAASNIVELLQIVRNVPDLRIVEGRFMSVPHAMAVPKGRPRAAALVHRFGEEAKASGLVQQAITRSGNAGLNVAPPGAR